ncbi:hypothetical protein T4A_2859 [Trichinella pseudospiralis]|uniref:Uncharacterized protein n=1 Tax=Trichinella pseudospiralis TaxID=6337 RepID=A0A0V1EJA6_TRIPS|nr:hypothetical protein T4A_2859 [Trichinella pseudospiralis]
MENEVILLQANFSVHCHSISQADTPDAEEEYVHVKAYYYNTESGNREDIKDFNFHHSSHCSVLFICTQAVMEDYDTSVCQGMCKYYTGTERTRHQIEVSSYVHDDLWY